MSSKDRFFKKMEDNTKAQQASDAVLKQDIFEFEKAVFELLQNIQSWFDDSPVVSQLTPTAIYEDGVCIDVSSLILSNGSKILKIKPEGLYYVGITGCLDVSIYNPSRSPSSTAFTLNWKDNISKINGWTISYQGYHNSPVQRFEFNQENFFKMIDSFA